MLIAIICFLMLVGRLIYINIGMSDFINKKHMSSGQEISRLIAEEVRFMIETVN